MLHVEGHSALVKLADSAKFGLAQCVNYAEGIIKQYKLNEDIYNQIRILHASHPDSEAHLEEQMKEIEALIAQIPEPERMGIGYVNLLSLQSMTVILIICFCLESYINNIAYYLFREKDYLGLLKDGHQTSSELIIDAINKMSVREKWQKVCTLKEANSFDRSRPPFQSFSYLFNFRDDLVHDKVTDYGKNKAKTRYNNKFPDPVLSFLTLEHAQFAANIYWDMVNELHELLGVKKEEFQKHYNLSAWRDEEQRKMIDKLVKTYESYNKGFPFSKNSVNN